MTTPSEREDPARLTEPQPSKTDNSSPDREAITDTHSAKEQVNGGMAELREMSRMWHMEAADVKERCQVWQKEHDDTASHASRLQQQIQQTRCVIDMHRNQIKITEGERNVWRETCKVSSLKRQVSDSQKWIQEYEEEAGDIALLRESVARTQRMIITHEKGAVDMNSFRESIQNLHEVVVGYEKLVATLPMLRDMVKKGHKDIIQFEDERLRCVVSALREQTGDIEQIVHHIKYAEKAAALVLREDKYKAMEIVMNDEKKENEIAEVRERVQRGQNMIQKYEILAIRMPSFWQELHLGWDKIQKFDKNEACLSAWKDEVQKGQAKIQMYEELSDEIAALKKEVKETQEKILKFEKANINGETHSATAEAHNNETTSVNQREVLNQNNNNDSNGDGQNTVPQSTTEKSSPRRKLEIPRFDFGWRKQFSEWKNMTATEREIDKIKRNAEPFSNNPNAVFRVGHHESDMKIIPEGRVCGESEEFDEEIADTDELPPEPSTSPGLEKTGSPISRPKTSRGRSSEVQTQRACTQEPCAEIKKNSSSGVSRSTPPKGRRSIKTREAKLKVTSTSQVQQTSFPEPEIIHQHDQRHALSSSVLRPMSPPHYLPPLSIQTLSGRGAPGIKDAESSPHLAPVSDRNRRLSSLSVQTLDLPRNPAIHRGEDSTPQKMRKVPSPRRLPSLSVQTLNLPENTAIQENGALSSPRMRKEPSPRHLPSLSVHSPLPPISGQPSESLRRTNRKQRNHRVAEMKTHYVLPSIRSMHNKSP